MSAMPRDQVLHRSEISRWATRRHSPFLSIAVGVGPLEAISFTAELSPAALHSFSNAQPLLCYLREGFIISQN